MITEKQRNLQKKTRHDRKLVRTKEYIETSNLMIFRVIIFQLSNSKIKTKLDIIFQMFRKEIDFQSNDFQKLYFNDFQKPLL